MGRSTSLECPRGCKAKDGSPVASTIKGWKRHMSLVHKGYAQAELDALIGTSAPNPSEGKAAFLAEAELAPEQTPATPPGEATEKPEDKPPIPIKTEQAARKMSGKLNKFKTELARRLPVSVNKGLTENAPTWAMSESDLSFMTESVESCFDVLDIDFQVKPLSMTLQNPLWVLILPLLALIVVFIPIGIKNAKLKQELDDEPAPDSNPVPVHSE